MIKKLRRKLVLINMCLAMSMLMVIFVLVYQLTAADLEDTSLATLQSAAQGHLRPRPGSQTAPCFSLEVTPGGTLLAVGTDYFDLNDADMIRDIYAKATEKDGQTGVLKEYKLRYLRTVGQGSDRVVFADISGEYETLTGLITSFIYIGIVSFLGFLGISILLARWAVKPVAQAWQQQRQFVADASHELKTPLTVILTNAELLRSPDYEPEEKSRFSQSILTMAVQMRGLVESLLELARVDNGRANSGHTQLELSRLVEEAILPFEPMYFEQGLELISSVEPGIGIRGNEMYLRQVVDILLDNGLKYSAGGQIVELELKRQKRGWSLLTVTTPGTPLTQEQCRDIFKRFYRVDSARTSGGSYGLGLSIAQRVVSEHGGKIWAEPLPKGNRFYVNLPES